MLLNKALLFLASLPFVFLTDNLIIRVQPVPGLYEKRPPSPPGEGWGGGRKLKTSRLIEKAITPKPSPRGEEASTNTKQQKIGGVCF
jgi:hypothetical protein